MDCKTKWHCIGHNKNHIEKNTMNAINRMKIISRKIYINNAHHKIYHLVLVMLWSSTFFFIVDGSSCSARSGSRTFWFPGLERCQSFPVWSQIMACVSYYQKKMSWKVSPRGVQGQCSWDFNVGNHDPLSGWFCGSTSLLFTFRANQEADDMKLELWQYGCELVLVLAGWMQGFYFSFHMFYFFL